MKEFFSLASIINIHFINRQEDHRFYKSILQIYKWVCPTPPLLLGSLSHLCACVLSHFSRVWLCPMLRTATCQTPVFMGFSRQEYWSGLPFPPPGDLPNPGIEPESLTSPALAGRFFTTSTTLEALTIYKQQQTTLVWPLQSRPLL